MPRATVSNIATKGRRAVPKANPPPKERLLKKNTKAILELLTRAMVRGLPKQRPLICAPSGVWRDCPFLATQLGGMLNRCTQVMRNIRRRYGETLFKGDEVTCPSARGVNTWKTGILPVPVVRGLLPHTNTWSKHLRTSEPYLKSTTL